MSLVKTSKIAAAGAPAVPIRDASGSAPMPAKSPHRVRAPVSGATPAKVSERIAAATEELSSGLIEASAAAEELRRSMEQIAAGAEEASGAAQEQVAAVKSVAASFASATAQSDAVRRRTEAVQVVLAESGVQINTSARAIERNGERQAGTIRLISELDRRAVEVGEITRTVSKISDQTNLLALNAAIEAARAGDHGRGFAVVADEVRALAETSDRSAKEVQALADVIQSEVRGVVEAIKAAAETAASEAKAGARVVTTLEAVREDMTRIAEGSQDTLTAALEAERASNEAQRGAERVASAAEEQSAAAAEAQAAIKQQVQSLEQGQTAAQALAGLTNDLKAEGDKSSAAQQIGAAAEELSATLQELSSAASQIMAAVEQISRGTEHQAAATQQSSAALAQIEKSARLAQKNATVAGERVELMLDALKESRTAIDRLVAGVNTALEGAKSSLSAILKLDGLGRKIEKIVDAIGLIVVQTNMLAVSGSVEAARAGGSGRGFAVVSNDIRGLAREASGSVERMTDTVRAILEEVASLRRELEQTIAIMEIEVQNNRAIFSTLEKLDTDLAALSAGNRTILQGAEAILAAAVQGAAGARQVATAAEEASAAAKQATSASSEQAQGAEDLAAAIEEIASLASELKEQNA